MALMVEMSSSANSRPMKVPRRGPNANSAAITPTSTLPTIASIGATERKTKFSRQYSVATTAVLTPSTQGKLR